MHNVNQNLISKLKCRYNLHPLIFQRSLEKSRTDAELFDILDTVPSSFPIAWCDETFRWVKVNDIYSSQDFFPEI
jgi:hypothetical protein